MSAHRQAESGFTLIEAMVALVILGIAAVSIVRASEAHVDSLRALERRAAAQWVAENALADLSLGSGANGISGEETMMGERWTIATDLSASEDPDLRLATIRVRPVRGGGPTITLKGIVDAGTVTL